MVKHTQAIRRQIAEFDHSVGLALKGLTASGLLKLLCCGSNRDTRERLIYVKLIIVLTPN